MIQVFTHSVPCREIRWSPYVKPKNAGPNNPMKYRRTWIGAWSYDQAARFCAQRQLFTGNG